MSELGPHDSFTCAPGVSNPRCREHGYGSSGCVCHSAVDEMSVGKEVVWWVSSSCLLHGWLTKEDYQERFWQNVRPGAPSNADAVESADAADRRLIRMAVTLAAAIRSREALSPETVAREAVATARAILAEVEGKK